jgi:hypothetical protein
VRLPLRIAPPADENFVREAPVTPKTIAQQVFNGPWVHSAAALEACRRGQWANFARKAAPRRPLLLGRFGYARCIEVAAGSLKGPLTTEVTLLPLWACQSHETPSTKWVVVHGAVWNGQPLEVIESGPFLDDVPLRVDALWKCSVRQWTAASVVKSERYGDSVALVVRLGAFAVLETRLVEVVSVDVHEAETLPRPQREVPIFAYWFEPRVRVSPELESQIRALSHTAPGDREGLP